jgi:hypothetical protein
VNTDDPLFEKTHNEAIKKAKEHQALVLTVNLHYPEFEKAVHAFLDAKGQKYAERGPMSKKVALCKAQAPLVIGPAVWKVVEAAVELRNELDHRKDQAEVQLRMDELRAAYLAALTPNHVEAEEGLGDAHIAAAAYQICISHFVVATEAAKTAGSGS